MISSGDQAVKAPGRSFDRLFFAIFANKFRIRGKMNCG